MPVGSGSVSAAAGVEHRDEVVARPLSDLPEVRMWGVIECAPDGMVMTDEHGVILMVNGQLEAMFGFDRGELLGRQIEELLPDRFRQVHTAHRTRYRVEPTVRSMGTGLELYGRRRDGSEFPVEVSLSPVVDEHGVAVIAAVRDISERVAAEAHAHLIRTTIDATHDGVFMFAPDTLRFTYVNHGAVEQTGYGRDELLAMTPLHIAPDFTRETFVALIEPLLSGETPRLTLNTFHRTKTGRDVPVEIVLEYPTPGHPTAKRVLVAIVRDITDRVVAAVEREQHERDRERLMVFEDRERIGRDLHDLVIQRIFAAGMGLDAVVSVVSPPPLADKIRAVVDELDCAIKELRSTIFGLSILETPQSIGARIGEIVDAHVDSLGFQPILIVPDGIETVPLVIVEQLLPSLNEALSNVARHAAATSVTITVTLTDHRLTVTVTDNGNGIDKHHVRGHGLGNLEARARRIGGSCCITNNDRAGGAIVTWQVPL
jgi:PAS domain S-box-containing protein